MFVRCAACVEEGGTGAVVALSHMEDRSTHLDKDTNLPTRSCSLTLTRMRCRKQVGVCCRVKRSHLLSRPRRSRWQNINTYCTNSTTNKGVGVY